MDSASYADPREKIFIHTDKPGYRLKDTMWLKGYILTAAEHTSNDSSRIAYVEIFDATGSVVKRVNPPCELGLFESYIALSTPDFSQGQYLLRAYTRYMRNFGDSLFFTLPFSITDPANDTWKISFQQLSLDSNRLKLSARISETQLAATGKKPVTIRLRSKNKSFFKTSFIPRSSGEIVADTLLPGVKDRNLVVEITGDNDLRISVPVTTGTERPVDVQFFPEGGSFVAGMMQDLGFKAINKKGIGIRLSGVIIDSKGITVANFSSLRYGMGVVSFKPDAGETYTAVSDMGERFSLPPVESSGISLMVQNKAGEDSVVISVKGSPDKQGRLVYFTATCRGLVLARGRIPLKKEPYELKLSRAVLPSGVIVCTLYDGQQYPINERSFFIWQNDGLQIHASPHKNSYSKKDSVSVGIRVIDKDQLPVAGSFSISVIDTSQVSAGPDRENLLSYMFLGSDLRGRIEEPYYYFRNALSEETEALMLTQGWVSYRRTNPTALYKYERNFSISGKVSNVFNKPLINTGITLFGKAGKNNAFLLDTTTTEKGEFVFNRFPLYETDSISMVIRALNRRGKAFNVGIVLDEPDYPSYSGQSFSLSTSSMALDTTAKKYMAARDSLAEQMKKDGTYLKEVVITGKATIPGSKNLNKDGGADQVINEAMLEKTPKATLLEVLEQQVKGFRMGILPKGTIYRYMISSNMTRFIIDGVDLEFFYNYNATSSSMDYLNYYKSQLSYFAAEDIKGIEVMNTPTYNRSYRSQFLSLNEQLSSGPVKIDYSFVEITTHSGLGPFLRKTPGMYLYKPVFPFISKQFYSPRYTSPDEVTAFPDFRSTIYWNPNIITNDKGEATVTFYTSESRSNYMMLIQGTDLKGGIGVCYEPLIIQ